MRVDISLDPTASHYCKHCGLTMKPGDQFDCSVCDGDMCEPRRRAKKPHDAERVAAGRKGCADRDRAKRLRDAERTAAGRKGCADRDRADAIAAARAEGYAEAVADVVAWLHSYAP